MGFNLQQFVNLMISSNPQMQNNPMMREMIGVIQSGNSMKGEQIAENLCKTHGMTREQATQQAMSWVQQMMFRR